jgi:predicted CxxxxCH...CXXCH cytochrome family protein
MSTRKIALWGTMMKSTWTGILLVVMLGVQSCSDSPVPPSFDWGYDAQLTDAGTGEHIPPGTDGGAIGSDGLTLDQSGSDLSSSDTNSLLDQSTIDGSNDASGGDSGMAGPCSKCHGSASNAAPPVGLSGETSTTTTAVGAHQAHLQTSNWHATVLCEDCHLVPTTVSDPGHIDTPLPADITFSSLASAKGSTAAWNGTTCTTYCHGATLSGGAVTQPNWTQVDGSQKACGSCHALPPTQNHTTSTNCSSCHGQVVDANNAFIAPALHINGTVEATSGHATGWGDGAVHGAGFMADTGSCSSCHGADLKGGSAMSCETCHTGWQTNCVFCHGGLDNQTGAPPYALDAATVTTDPGVGQHSAHVQSGDLHTGMDCDACHTKPAEALSVGHIDSAPAELNFSGLGSTTSYDFQTNVCSNVYCHGDGQGNNGSVSWTGGLSGGCSACHDDESDGKNMTLSGEHEEHVEGEGYSCSTCHSCVVNSSKKITNKANHIDGTATVCGVGSWNASNKSCNPACHGSETWN